MNELWKSIPLKDLKGYYEASSLGNIRSIDRKIMHKNGRTVRYKGKVLKQRLHKDYLLIGIHKKSLQVHRLVALSFIPNPNNKPEINHKSGVKTDNSVENLEWSTRGENVDHAVSTGLIDFKGEKNPAHKLTEKDVIEIRIKATMYKDMELSAMYRVHRSTINQIKIGKKWKHLPSMPEKIITRK